LAKYEQRQSGKFFWDTVYVKNEQAKKISAK